MENVQLEHILRKVERGVNYKCAVAAWNGRLVAKPHRRTKADNVIRGPGDAPESESFMLLLDVNGGA